MSVLAEPAPARKFSSLAREIIIRCIANCDDPSDQKNRIVIAVEEGVISEDDAEALIAIFELKSA